MAFNEEQRQEIESIIKESFEFNKQIFVGCLSELRDAGELRVFNLPDIIRCFDYHFYEGEIKNFESQCPECENWSCHNLKESVVPVSDIISVGFYCDSCHKEVRSRKIRDKK